MLWLSRPPYLRWVGAGVVVVLALYGRLAPTATELRPFADRAIAVGEQVTASDVEFRPVPVGLLPDVRLPLVADRPVEAGEPVLPARTAITPPENWWVMELGVPSGAVPGAAARLVAAGPVTAVVPGMVVGLTGTADAFSGGLRALVAVPAEAIETVASAAAEQRLTVLLEAASIPRFANTDAD